MKAGVLLVVWTSFWSENFPFPLLPGVWPPASIGGTILLTCVTCSFSSLLLSRHFLSCQPFFLTRSRKTSFVLLLVQSILYLLLLDLCSSLWFCWFLFHRFPCRHSWTHLGVLILVSSVNKNNSNTPFCSEFSAFLKPFSVNCDWKMLSITNTYVNTCVIKCKPVHYLSLSVTKERWASQIST